MKEYRVLVTGSRDWLEPLSVHAELQRELTAMPPGYTMVVVHGAAPSGVDFFASEWAELQQSREMPYGVKVREEPHPADWETHKKAAGPIRNQEMVDAGADIALAFRLNGKASRGTTDCMNRAWKAHIPIRALEERTPPDEGSSQ